MDLINWFSFLPTESFLPRASGNRVCQRLQDLLYFFIDARYFVREPSSCLDSCNLWILFNFFSASSHTCCICFMFTLDFALWQWIYLCLVNAVLHEWLCDCFMYPHQKIRWWSIIYLLMGMDCNLRHRRYTCFPFSFLFSWDSSTVRDLKKIWKMLFSVQLLVPINNYQFQWYHGVKFYEFHINLPVYITYYDILLNACEKDIQRFQNLWCYILNPACCSRGNMPKVMVTVEEWHNVCSKVKQDWQ